MEKKITKVELKKMRIKSRIKILIKNIELQKEAIAELRDIHRKNKKPVEDIKVISKKLKENEKSLKNLKRQYDQSMLSKLAKNGIEDEETNAWWMNRY